MTLHQHNPLNLADLHHAGVAITRPDAPGSARCDSVLLLVASEVAHELEYRSPADGAEFRNHLRALGAPESPPR